MAPKPSDTDWGQFSAAAVKFYTYLGVPKKSWESGLTWCCRAVQDSKVSIRCTSTLGEGYGQPWIPMRQMFYFSKTLRLGELLILDSNIKTAWIPMWQMFYFSKTVRPGGPSILDFIIPNAWT